MVDPLNVLVEGVRAASFDAPRAYSHTEWAARIKGLVEQVGWRYLGDPNKQIAAGVHLHHFHVDDCEECLSWHTDCEPVYVIRSKGESDA